MHIINLWKGLRSRFVIRGNSEHEATRDSIPTAGTSQQVISYCLQVLNSYPASRVLYMLACLCPYEVAVLDLVRLDLSLPHQHKQRSEIDVCLRHDSYEQLLSHLRAYTSLVPTNDYRQFWLDLTQSWLLSCPLDPDYYREDETGKELYCQRLRGELIDRILNIT